MYWSVVYFSIGMFIFSRALDYSNVGIPVYLFLAIILGITLICNEWGNSIDEKLAKTKREKGETTTEIVLSKEDATRVIRLRLTTYAFLLVFVACCVYVAAPATDNPYFLVAGYAGAFLGGRMPDFDKDIVDDDMRFHRNPITHSGILVMPLAVLALLTVEKTFVSLDLVAIGLMLGVASHCLADNFETKSTLIQIIVDFEHFKKCPGDIRHIKETRQRAWINFHGVILLFTAILLYLRFELVSYMTADPVTWNGASYTVNLITPMTMFIIFFAIVYYVLSFVFLVAWRKGPEKENHNGEKHDGEKHERKNGTSKAAHEHLESNGQSTKSEAAVEHPRKKSTKAKETPVEATTPEPVETQSSDVSPASDAPAGETQTEQSKPSKNKTTKKKSTKTITKN
ncbi:MAG TPA: metal-dependent hydrolase [Candidatus Lokiarchaeia archaeon]|nr:metal-dependent hydrolase [Candidatus Lokiarchaeia archaeon]